jgi:hypothetical protein
MSWGDLVLGSSGCGLVEKSWNERRHEVAFAHARLRESPSFG